jgi:hypothetical protein
MSGTLRVMRHPENLDCFEIEAGTEWSWAVKPVTLFREFDSG